MSKVVNLALQGGGSHGAFTWGVLDRLLEEEALDFEGITGTSAGAVNAVVLADGLAAGGREGARNALRAYWQKVSALFARGIFRPSLIDKGSSDFGLEHSPGFRFFEPMIYFASPYQTNPFNHNPFRDMLAEAINFERVRQQTEVKLFLCATNVQTAKVKIFAGKELRVEHVLASTCLPLLMQAVEVDGEYYWDGSYAGNPAIFPLVYDCDSRDILMVHVTPAERPGAQSERGENRHQKNRSQRRGLDTVSLWSLTQCEAHARRQQRLRPKNRSEEQCFDSCAACFLCVGISQHPRNLRKL